MKRKNWFHKCVVVTMVSVLGLTACGKAEDIQTVKTETVAKEISEAAETGGDVVETTTESAVQPILYEYEQELNIIDDNYRNYYEIFVYSFYDSDGDGIGDLNGVIEKLDYVQEMGFNGIWLMPVMPSTTYHKYDVTDYYGIEPEYGTMEDFERLVEECHKRDIRLIIDFVMNHSSSKHPWFLEA